jgi:hypothetical protein
LKNLTTFLALWGAILSSITFGWNLFRDLRDRANVKVDAMLRYITTDAVGKTVAVSPRVAADHQLEGAHPDRLFVLFLITNVGRRPVTIRDLAGKRDPRRSATGKSGFIIYPDNLPKSLSEGESVQELSELDCLSDDVTVIYASDSTGHHWKVPKRTLRDLKRELKALREAKSLT